MTNSSAWALVRGIEPMSLCDWPGRLSAVVFFGGCTLRCPHCHNAALAWTPDTVPALAEKAVRRFIDSHKRWLDGLVVTGGEPTLVPGLPGFVAAIAAAGLPVKVDSNGLRPEVLAALLACHPDVHLAVDVKAPFAKYPLVTGGAVSADTARQCLGQVFALAVAHPGRIRFRTTCVPELSEADCREVRSAVPAGHALTLQPFRPIARHGEEREHAQADSQTRRLSGNMEHPAHCPGDLKSPQSQRH
ncbi:radical SAM protein [Solidesulfovibrio sp.]